MLQFARLIFILAFTLAGDTLFSVAIIWRVLAQGGSTKMLAYFLCSVVLLTFYLQRNSEKLKKSLEKNPETAFAKIRVIGIICSVIFVPLLWHETIMTLYFAGMVFTVVNFFSLLTVESMMGKEVLAGSMTSHQASRILQTGMQIAAFLGASMAGLILGHGGIKSVLLVNILTFASGTLIASSISGAKNDGESLIKSQAKTDSPLSGNKIILWATFIGLIFLTSQIAIFNFLVPQIAQLEKSWTATEFGLIDAIAGLGAFICTLVSVEKSWLSKSWVLSCLGIFIADLSFHYVQQATGMFFIVFMLGFFVNALRIKQREIMYDAVSNVNELYEWVGRITIMTSFVKAFCPLLLVYLTMMPSQNFMICGVVIGVGILLTQIIYFLAQRQRVSHVILQETFN